MDVNELMRNLTYSNQTGSRVNYRNSWYSNWYNGIPASIRTNNVPGLTRQVAWVNGKKIDNPALIVNKSQLPYYFLPTWFTAHNQNNQWVNYWYNNGTQKQIAWNRQPDVIINDYRWHADTSYTGGHKYNYSARPHWNYTNKYVRFNVHGGATNGKTVPMGELLDDVGIMGRFQGSNNIFEFNNINPTQLTLSHDDKWHGHTGWFYELDCTNCIIIFNILSNLRFGAWKYRAADTPWYFFKHVSGSGNWIIINVFNTTFQYDRLNAPIHQTTKYNTLYNFWGGGSITSV